MTCQRSGVQLPAGLDDFLIFKNVLGSGLIILKSKLEKTSTGLKSKEKYFLKRIQQNIITNANFFTIICSTCDIEKTVNTNRQENVV